MATVEHARRWYVYVLRCADGSLYTGATTDVDRRLAVHASGKGAAYTRSRLPLTLVHTERAADRSAALRREAAIKRLGRAAKLKLIGKGARARPKARRSPRAEGAVRGWPPSAGRGPGR